MLKYMKTMSLALWSSRQSVLNYIYDNTVNCCKEMNLEKSCVFFLLARKARFININVIIIDKIQESVNLRSMKYA